MLREDEEGKGGWPAADFGLVCGIGDGGKAPVKSRNAGNRGSCEFFLVFQQPIKRVGVSELEVVDLLVAM